MTVPSAAGPVALVGGDEFLPGNEEHDRYLANVARAHGGPAFVVATAAREHPDAAVATAVGWFASLGLTVAELRLRTRTEADDEGTAREAARASLVYLAGGDPGRVPQVLGGTLGHRWLPSVAPIASEAGISLVGIDERTAGVWRRDVARDRPGRRCPDGRVR